MVEFRMPALGADMAHGTVLEWLVEPGDPVHRGDVIAVVDTDKCAIDVECFTDGVVDRLLVAPGRTVPVGTPLALITAPGTEPAAPASVDGSSEVHNGPESAEVTPPTPRQPEPPHRWVAAGQPLASPPVRRLAARVGVDLAEVPGTGRGGAITRADIESAAHRQAAPTPAPVAAPSRTRTRQAPATVADTTDGTARRAQRRAISPYARKLAAELGVEPSSLAGTGADGAIRARDVRIAARQAKPTGPATGTTPPAPERGTRMRQATAELMSRANREIPHYHLSTTIDFAPATNWLRERNLRVPIEDRLVPAALLLKASALAARRVPALNGHWLDGAFVPSDAVRLGVAVSLRGGGLVAPTIGAADELALPELMRRLRDLVSRARAGRLRSSEVTGATITVTNLGDLGVESVHGVIHPPQVALVGFGAVVDRPWAVDGLLGVRPVVTATLAGDHRASDGATGARLLNVVDELLRHPEELL